MQNTKQQDHPALTLLGFTGTRQGMTEPQRDTVKRLLVELAPAEAHHGDCIGSDAEFHDLVAQHLPVAQIIVHPPSKSSARAFCQGHREMPPAEFLVRNHHIVDASTVMIATLQESQEQRRSGTWATIRYAIRRGKTVHVVAPDGSTATHQA